MKAKTRPGLRTILTFAFGLIAVMSTLAFYLVVHTLFGSRFGEYMETRMKNTINKIEASLEQSWDLNNGWSASYLSEIGRTAETSGIVMTLTSPTGQVLWPPVGHRLMMPGMRQGNGMNQRGTSSTKSDSTAAAEHGRSPLSISKVSYDIKVDGVLVGVCAISAPTYFLDEQDESFVRAVDVAMIATGAALLLLGMLISLFAARSLSTTFAAVSRTTSRIKEGHFGETVKQGSGIREVHDIIESVNKLSVTLEEQETMQKRLISDVAHDLRTPVTILTSHLEAIRDGVFEGTAEQMEVCLDEAKRLGRLVSGIEQLARLEAGLAGLRLEPLDLKVLAERSQQSWKPLFEKKGVSLVTEGETVTVMGDETGIGSIFQNLLGNALRHTPEGGRVSMNTVQEGKWAILEIRDTGCGISSDMLPHVFERFFRSDASRNSGSGGTGLGLAIVQSMVEAHGGTIAVSSQVDVGTVFVVRLPVE